MRLRGNNAGNEVKVLWKDEAFDCVVSAAEPRQTYGVRAARRRFCVGAGIHHPCQSGSKLPHSKRFATFGRRGFTLIEILVVIGIIGIIAALLLPVLSGVKRRGQIAVARTEMSTIQSAIMGYFAAYGRFPQPNAAITSDFTFGPAGIGSTVGTYSANNSELMAILMDLNQLSNTNHTRNPRQMPFLTPLTRGKSVNDPGLGPDFVYRDPWSHPYVITIDYDYNNQCLDAFYSKSTVSSDPSNPNSGYNGLVRTGTTYQMPGQIMIWSLGPDGSADAATSAISAANKDNVLNWIK